MEQSTRSSRQQQITEASTHNDTKSSQGELRRQIKTNKRFLLEHRRTREIPPTKYKGTMRRVMNYGIEQKASSEWRNRFQNAGVTMAQTTVKDKQHLRTMTLTAKQQQAVWRTVTLHKAATTATKYGIESTCSRRIVVP